LPEVQERWPAIKAALEERGYKPMAISAMARTNLDALLWKALELLQTAPVFEAEAEIPVYRPEEDIHDYVITRDPKGWRVSGKGIERAAAMTYWEYEGSLRRFQRLMEKIGLDDALRETGIQEGETVFIGEYELEWQD
jgi:GTP-binding protein